MNKWDIVLLTYPFTDLTATKVRPAVVVSQTSYNQASQDAVFILITTNVTRSSAFDIVVSQSHPEFHQTGLRHESAIRIDKIFTLNKKLAAKTLGRLEKQLQKEVEKQLRLFLELPGEQLALKI
jgi:mRNA interferase MazF